MSASVVSVADRGFQYGDGVFTTLSVKAGYPLIFTRHLDRLERDCFGLNIPFPGRALLSQDLAAILRDHTGNGVVKIQITRGIGGRGYKPPDQVTPTRVLALYPPASHPLQFGTEGVEVRWCSTRLGSNPALAGYKHMNRLEQVLARQEWSDSCIAEGLMLDSEGYVTEGTMSNLFLIKSGHLMTPRLDRCGVAGVMRQLILECGAAMGLPVEETRLLPADVETADHLFLTNSVAGIWPVRKLADFEYPIGILTRKIAEWLTTTLHLEQTLNPL